MILRLLTAVALTVVSPLLLADALTGDVQKQAINYTAIAMFVAFIGFTMGITKWSQAHGIKQGKIGIKVTID